MEKLLVPLAGEARLLDAALVPLEPLAKFPVITIKFFDFYAFLKIEKKVLGEMCALV